MIFIFRISPIKFCLAMQIYEQMTGVLLMKGNRGLQTPSNNNQAAAITDQFESLNFASANSFVHDPIKEALWDAFLVSISEVISITAINKYHFS